MRHIFYSDFIFWDKAPNHNELKAVLLPMIKERLAVTKDQNKWICDVNTEFFSKDNDISKYINLIVGNIYPVLDNFFEELSFLTVPKQSKVAEIWYNHYNSGHYQEVHTHSGQMDISGIYLLSLEEVNKTVFYSYPTTNTKLYGAAKKLVEATEGDIILFPSHLSHYVLPCEKERTSIAFNIKCDF
jgi:hypothetical protein